MNSAKYIADRIRLLIATKQFQVDEVLPSTRVLGQQLKVSFHTVRKAYHILEEEGILRAEKGRGFVVTRQTTTLDKSERLEIGAERFRTLLEELIGYGLDEDEIETLFEEQLSYMEWPDRLESCATIGATSEHAAMISRSIQKQVGIKSSTLTIDEIDKTVNYDALFVPVSYFRRFRNEINEDIVMIPIIYSFDPEFLINIIEKQGIETVGLVTQEEDTIPIIIEELKLSLKFSGSIIAGSVYGKSMPLFVREVDLIIYTPGSASLAEKQLPDKKRLALDYVISEHSTSIIRSELWDQ